MSPVGVSSRRLFFSTAEPGTHLTTIYRVNR
jgi:hypothetical protein